MTRLLLSLFAILLSASPAYAEKCNGAKNYYDILGVQKGASGTEVKQAWRKLVQKYHSDKPENRGKPDAELKLREINEAHDCLGDEQARAAYDRGLGSASAGPSRQQSAEDWMSAHFENIGIYDVPGELKKMAMKDVLDKTGRYEQYLKKFMIDVAAKASQTRSNPLWYYRESLLSVHYRVFQKTHVGFKIFMAFGFLGPFMAQGPNTELTWALPILSSALFELMFQHGALGVRARAREMNSYINHMIGVLETDPEAFKAALFSYDVVETLAYTYLGTNHDSQFSGYNDILRLSKAYPLALQGLLVRSARGSSRAAGFRDQLLADMEARPFFWQKQRDALLKAASGKMSEADLSTLTENLPHTDPRFAWLRMPFRYAQLKVSQFCDRVLVN